jgi:hypothetical protein
LARSQDYTAKQYADQLHALSSLIFRNRATTRRELFKHQTSSSDCSGIRKLLVLPPFNHLHGIELQAAPVVFNSDFVAV